MRIRQAVRHQDSDPAAEMATVQVPVPMLGVLADVRNRFFALCLDAGRQVPTAMIEQDRSEACEPKWKPNPTRRARRGGSAPSEVTLGGRRIPIRRLHARSRAGTEVPFPSFHFAAAQEPLDARTLEAIGIGVSTRHYRRSLDAMPPREQERAVSKSSVSRRFVALTTEAVKRWLTQSLNGLDLCVVLIDGIVFHEHCILIALGIAGDGTKHVLGLREGSMENATVADALLGDLISRGLPSDRALLFVIDGGKGIHKAIRDTFGDLAVIHRCHVHKKRNVRRHLPERLQASIIRAMNDA